VASWTVPLEAAPELMIKAPPVVAGVAVVPSLMCR